MTKEEYLKSLLYKQIYEKYVVEKDGRCERQFIEKEVTAMFIDIQGFTKITRKISPKDLILDLDDYFNRVIRIVEKNNGFIENIIGDALIAIFGEDNNKCHADDACTAAVEVVKNIHESNINRVDKIEISVGIGINTGLASMGFFGNRHHYQFMVVSENVNLAARMQGLTNFYKKEIIISGQTQEMIKKNFNIQLIETVAIKGKENGVSVYEILV